MILGLSMVRFPFVPVLCHERPTNSPELDVRFIRSGLSLTNDQNSVLYL